MHLAVYELNALAREPPYQGDERDLRGIVDLGEHALAEEDVAQRHPVQPADELSVLPALDAMGVAAVVQLQAEPVDLDLGPELLGGNALLADDLDGDVLTGLLVDCGAH